MWSALWQSVQLASGSAASSQCAAHLVFAGHVHGDAVLRLLVAAVHLVGHVRRGAGVGDLRLHLLCICAWPAPGPAVSCVCCVLGTEAELGCSARTVFLHARVLVLPAGLKDHLRGGRE